MTKLLNDVFSIAAVTMDPVGACLWLLGNYNLFINRQIYESFFLTKRAIKYLNAEKDRNRNRKKVLLSFFSEFFFIFFLLASEGVGRRGRR